MDRSLGQEMSKKRGDKIARVSHRKMRGGRMNLQEERRLKREVRTVYTASEVKFGGKSLV